MPHHSLRLQVPCNSVHLSWLYGLCHRMAKAVGLHCPHYQTLNIFAPPPVRERSIAMSVCLSVCPRAYLRNTRPDFTKFSVQATRSRMARSSSGGVGICYVFLVWWITSYFLPAVQLAFFYCRISIRRIKHVYRARHCNRSRPSVGLFHSSFWTARPLTLMFYM